MKTAQHCQNVELVLSDVDGVLTDGGIILDNQGIETKRFHVRDGLGVKLWRRAGGRLGLITGRSSNVVKLRATELGADVVRQGSDEKLKVVEEIVAELGLAPEAVCYIGDDLPDVPAIRYAGLGVAVADACEEARQAADWVSTLGGGQGALRETIEMILKSQRRWEDLIQNYL